MNLRPTALAAALGIAAALVIRTLGTAAPGLFRSFFPLTLISILILAAAALSLGLFFLAFHLERSSGLKALTPALLAALGAGAVFLLQLKSLGLFLGLASFSRPFISPFVEAAIPGASALLTLLFFVHWPEETLVECGGYVRPALWGAAILLGIRILVLANFVIRPGARWFSDLPKVLGVVMIPGVIIGSLLIIRFLLWMYRAGWGVAFRAAEGEG